MNHRYMLPDGIIRYCFSASIYPHFVWIRFAAQERNRACIRKTTTDQLRAKLPTMEPQVEGPRSGKSTASVRNAFPPGAALYFPFSELERYRACIRVKITKISVRDCSPALPGAGLAPEGGEHGNDLLFAAHDLRQEDGVVLGAGVEGLADGLVVPHIDQLSAFQQHIGEHQNHH